MFNVGFVVVLVQNELCVIIQTVCLSRLLGPVEDHNVLKAPVQLI
jgi:hypothetical protein